MTPHMISYKSVYMFMIQRRLPYSTRTASVIRRMWSLAIIISVCCHNLCALSFQLLFRRFEKSATERKRHQTNYIINCVSRLSHVCVYDFNAQVYNSIDKSTHSLTHWDTRAKISLQTNTHTLWESRAVAIAHIHWLKLMQFHRCAWQFAHAH